MHLITQDRSWLLSEFCLNFAWTTITQDDRIARRFAEDALERQRQH